MATETTSFAPVKLFAGDVPAIFSAPCTVVLGQNLAQYTVVESDTNGKMKLHSGTQTVMVAGVLVFGATTPASDQPTFMYESGCFHADQLVFPTSASTNLLKRKLLEGSNIRVVFQDTGEV